jgi:GMP synthase-like glutamine amidotransferase
MSSNAGSAGRKPVAIFRFSETEGPGYFAQWLDARGIPWTLIPLDEGVPVPQDPRAYSGIGMMGGPMSANDDLPWIPPLLDLLRSSVQADVPVIGHCLGGQLFAKALGAPVTPTSTPEIGWQDVEVIGKQGREWFGGRTRFTTFEWHYDVFALPAGATRVLTNALNENQAYVIGKHIGFQCHIEMTTDILESWCKSGSDELKKKQGPGIQTEAEICRALDTRLPHLSSVASDVYARWVQGLAR